MQLYGPNILTLDFINNLAMINGEDYAVDAGATPNRPNAFTNNVISFTRAGVATRVNSSGLIENVAANTPRFDYDPVTLQPKGLLIEESRTNVLTYSERIDTAPWVNVVAGTASTPVITPDAAISPDGQLTADRIQFTLNGGITTNDFARRAQSYVTPATSHTFSVYVRSYDGVSSYNMHAVGPTGASTPITVTGSWQRIVISGIGTGNSVAYAIGLRGGLTPANSNSADILVWGAQVEAGQFATSYIPTAASIVTRNADLCSMSGSNFANFYNQQEGTFIFSGDTLTTDSGTRASFGVYTDVNNRIYATVQSNYTGFFSRTNSNQLVNLSSSGSATLTANVPYKAGYAYRTNDFSLVVNTIVAATQSTGSVPIVNTLYIGSTSFSIYCGHVRLFRYYPRRLSNTQIQSLTA